MEDSARTQDDIIAHSQVLGRELENINLALTAKIALKDDIEKEITARTAELRSIEQQTQQFKDMIAVRENKLVLSENSIESRSKELERVHAERSASLDYREKQIESNELKAKQELWNILAQIEKEKTTIADLGREVNYLNESINELDRTILSQNKQINENEVILNNQKTTFDEETKALDKILAIKEREIDSASKAIQDELAKIEIPSKNLAETKQRLDIREADIETLATRNINFRRARRNREL